MTAAIGLRTVKVKAFDGEMLQAKLNYCAECRNEAFQIYIIDGDTHEHWQCAGCGVVYCHGTGRCAGQGEVRS